MGSAFAAELGTMQVSEQTDSLRVLGTDPVDYLVSPRVVACMIAGPILNVLCFTMGTHSCPPRPSSSSPPSFASRDLHHCRPNFDVVCSFICAHLHACRKHFRNMSHAIKPLHECVVACSDLFVCFQVHAEQRCSYIRCMCPLASPAYKLES